MLRDGNQDRAFDRAPARGPDDGGAERRSQSDRDRIDRSTLADIAYRLVRKGLLQRRRSKEDTRAYVVRLTEAGRHVLRTTEPLTKRIDRRVLDALPANRREEFVTALASIIGKLERTAPA